MFKNILHVRMRNNLMNKTLTKIKMQSTIINSTPKYELNTNFKRVIDIEKNEKIDNILKHKNFV
jgi:hypothetical protein